MQRKRDPAGVGDAAAHQTGYGDAGCVGGAHDLPGLRSDQADPEHARDRHEGDVEGSHGGLGSRERGSPRAGGIGLSRRQDAAPARGGHIRPPVGRSSKCSAYWAVSDGSCRRRVHERTPWARSPARPPLRPTPTARAAAALPVRLGQALQGLPRQRRRRVAVRRADVRGPAGECDWVALREFVPAGTAPADGGRGRVRRRGQGTYRRGGQRAARASPRLWCATTGTSGSRPRWPTSRPTRAGTSPMRCGWVWRPTW